MPPNPQPAQPPPRSSHPLIYRGRQGVYKMIGPTTPGMTDAINGRTSGDKEMSLRGFLTRLFRKPTPTPTSVPTPFPTQKPVLELNDEKKKELDRWYAEGNAEKYPESAADLKIGRASCRGRG